MGLAVFLIVAAAAAGTAVWVAVRPAPPAVVRTEVTTSGATALLINGYNRDLAITPDGSRIVYRGQAQLLVRALDRLEPTVLGGLGLPRGVFTSPDGQWVGFFDGNTFLKKVAITGGAPVLLSTIGSNGSRGGDVGTRRNNHLRDQCLTSGLCRVSAGGGTPTVQPGRTRTGQRPIMSGQVPARAASPCSLQSRPRGDREMRKSRCSTSKPAHARRCCAAAATAHVPTGHLVYGAGGTLRAVRFNLARLK